MYKRTDTMYKRTDTMYRRTDTMYKRTDTMYKRTDTMYKRTDTLHTLQSWNIFEEKNGQVVVKLRFDSGHYSPPSKEPVVYKRKAPSQVKRDGDRLATYRRNQAKAAGDHDVAYFQNSQFLHHQHTWI